MSHPLEHLVELVDGALPARERAVVLEHLLGCPRCRAEVAAATSARDALANLEAPPVPAGLGDRAIAEARRAAASREPEVASMDEARARQQRWSRVAAGAGIAAVLVLGIAIALPRIGVQTTQDVHTEAVGTVDTVSSPSVASAVEIIDRDFDFEAVRELANESRGIIAADAAFAGATEGAPAAASEDVSIADAVRCLRTAFEKLPGEPIRVVRASFEGTPAYLGVFAVGPGAGQPVNELQVKVAAIEGCRVVSDSRIAL